MKRILLLLLLTFSLAHIASAQPGSFCDAVTAILHDAPNKFRNIRGKLTEANANASEWECGVKVPGVIKSRFVFSMGLFYEGAILQTKNKEDVKMFYDRCKILLDTCLTAQGYTLSLNDNFYPGLADYKKLVYMTDAAEDEKTPPPHVTLEVAYSKEMGLYTVVMYIFEH